MLCLTLSGCALGPNFHKPEPPQIASYTPQPLPDATSSSPVAIGVSQKLELGATVSKHWWTSFGSPELDALEDEALRHNPDVESASAALRAARATYLAQRGSLFPTVTANFQAQRQKSSDVLAPPLNDNATTFNLFTASATLDYTLDIFGGVRRGVEGARAQAEAQRFQTEAVYLTVTTNVASTAITLASLGQQIAVTERVVDAARKFLTIVRQQQQLGSASGADVAAAQLAYSQAEATLPTLNKQRAQAIDFLAVLVGRYPAEQFAAPALASLQLPAALPISLPSQLVGQRPDIRMAEANLHYAYAQVGVAIAARLPNFSINGAAGGTSTVLGTVFSNGNIFWSVAGNVLQPIFDGGTLLEKQRAAQAALDQAKAQYRSTVLAAMQNVADTLQAVTADADGLRSAAAAQAAAAQALRVAREQARLGQISGGSTLALEAASLQAEASLIQAQASRLTDSVLLYQAIGGGWWDSDPAFPTMSIRSGR
ncbi:MAG: efflux transporter outer membrane subunit [Alphaproteobacteria bacterium]|nr:efflux transporter outer membrane subunit [Alphaproteobacteria bacterium]